MAEATAEATELVELAELADTGLADMVLEVRVL